MEEERIRDIEEILVDVINGRSVNPELKRKLEERTGKQRHIYWKEANEWMNLKNE